MKKQNKMNFKQKTYETKKDTLIICFFIQKFEICQFVFLHLFFSETNATRCYEKQRKLN